MNYVKEKNRQVAVLFWCICLCVTSCEVEFAIAEMACVSRNIRTAVPAAYGIPVQRSISGRDVSHPRVELGLTSSVVEFEKAEAQAFRV